MSSAMIVALGAEVVILVVVVAVVMPGAVMAAWTSAGNLNYRTKCTWRHSRPSRKAPNSRSMKWSLSACLLMTMARVTLNCSCHMA